MQRDIEQDDVELLLDAWAEEMRRWKNEAGGYPAEASGGMITSWRKDFEEMADAADAEMVAKVDACVDSLKPIHRDALMRRYRLGANVWRFPVPASFDQVKEAIRPLLLKKGLL
jgi:hypothetical protein